MMIRPISRAAIFIFIVCGWIAAFSPSLHAETNIVQLGGYEIEYEEFFQDDTDQDGKLDKKSYYNQGYLILTAWDTGGDGKDDLWFRYDGQDYLDLEVADLDSDNMPDQFISVNHDEEAYISSSNPVIFLELKILAAALLLLIVVLLIREKRQSRLKKGTNIIIILLITSLLLTGMPGQYLRAQDVYNEDGSINKKVFKQDWKKYSDIDERIPLQSRSYAAQRYAAVLAQIADNRVEIYVLKQEMEIDRLQRIQLREYKQALVANIRDNLIKAMIRLSYVTYTTIKAGKGMSKNYGKLFSGSVSNIEKIGSGLKVITGLQPQPNSPATIGSAAENMGKAGVLEYLDTLGDPKKAGKAIFDEAVKQSQGLAGLSPDISPEEIAILKEQHLKNRGIDKVLEESYKLNRERRIRIQELEKATADLEKELARWEKEEKQRVWDELSSNKPDNTDSNDPGQINTGSDQADNTIYYDTTAVGSIINENPISEETIIANQIAFHYPSQGGPMDGEGHMEIKVFFDDHSENVVIDMDFEGIYSPDTGQIAGDVSFAVAITYYYYKGGITSNQYETDTAEWYAQVSGNTIDGRVEDSHQFQLGGPFNLTMQR